MGSAIHIAVPWTRWAAISYLPLRSINYGKLTMWTFAFFNLYILKPYELSSQTIFLLFWFCFWFFSCLLYLITGEKTRNLPYISTLLPSASVVAKTSEGKSWWWCLIMRLPAMLAAWSITKYCRVHIFSYYYSIWCIVLFSI